LTNTQSGLKHDRILFMQSFHQFLQHLYMFKPDEHIMKHWTPTNKYDRKTGIHLQWLIPQ